MEEFELIRGSSDDIWGLQLKARNSEVVHTWWMLDSDLARLHGRIHGRLNRDDEWLNEKAGIKFLTMDADSS